MSTSVSPDAARIWRAARAPLVIAVAVLVTAVVLTLANSDDAGELDTGSAGENGSRAVATLLTEQGVRVEPAHSSDGLDPSGATLLVTRPELVSVGTLRRLTESADSVVLLAPSQTTLDAVARELADAGTLPEQVREPGCAVPAATAAGAATLGGVRYAATVTCYDGALATAGPVTVLGTSTPFTNAALDDEGNAALTLRLLGEHERLVWYLPSAGDPGLRGGTESLTDLLPDAWVFGAVQVAVAAVLVALWRARRLGPVVTEPLPVAVRAAETVEGRARLYRGAGATDHAADALRRASIDRLRPALGLPADAEPDAVVAAVEARTGRPARALLYGPPPAGDAALVRLANDLDALENEVRL
ncbi:DUF4350 domain-containing protein [Prauserella cavernicola]|uniref:DUF4350 domain-containing protein n=1 Tax=Prauserella cavernicola TaxID=2800127 RepID=A0A934QZK9_9PSEU|nr:DUF4350 domain-containing protein [Prauserella cavernicola]MBK1788972.1 DUF4350 domain-containing protein [Prauserella cavernicola]